MIGGAAVMPCERSENGRRRRGSDERGCCDLVGHRHGRCWRAVGLPVVTLNPAPTLESDLEFDPVGYLACGFLLSSPPVMPCLSSKAISTALGWTTSKQRPLIAYSRAFDRIQSSRRVVPGIRHIA